MADFIPRSDAGLLAWAQNFSTLITATPTAYGLTSTIATTLAGKVTAYDAALTAATDPGTRGGSTIFAKDNARVDLVAYCRTLARAIQGTITVTNQQRYDLGLTVRVQPSPIPPPGSSPGILIESTDGRTVTIRLIDPENPTRRGKPPGVDGATVLSYVGATAPEDPGAWKFEGSITRTQVNVVFPTTVAAGSKVWLTAFWFNARSESGPACAPVSTYVQFGGEMPMAA